jgi:hypothetical protein
MHACSNPLPPLNILRFKTNLIGRSNVEQLNSQYDCLLDFPMMTLVGPRLSTRKIKTLFSIKNLRISKYTFIAKDYEEILKYM